MCRILNEEGKLGSFEMGKSLNFGSYSQKGYDIILVTKALCLTGAAIILALGRWSQKSRTAREVTQLVEY